MKRFLSAIYLTYLLGRVNIAVSGHFWHFRSCITRHIRQLCTTMTSAHITTIAPDRVWQHCSRLPWTLSGSPPMTSYTSYPRWSGKTFSGVECISFKSQPADSEGSCLNTFAILASLQMRSTCTRSTHLSPSPIPRRTRSGPRRNGKLYSRFSIPRSR